ncbi:MAG: SIMPL domain-containing protein [Deltaproteobacteria bacterium]|nr:SIMPL domain-containing protein [Deltaproteobacteria bacterium]
MSRRHTQWLPLMILVGLTAGTTVVAEEKTDERKRTIAVTGQAEVQAPPDRLTVSFAVETTAARATDAAAENAKRSSAVAAALKAQIAAGDSVSSTRYSLDPRYDTARPGESREPRITGYVARNEVQVESRKIDSAGALIDAAIAAGANRISGLQFSLSQRAEVLRGAIEKAGADAQAQAESVAKGLGVRLKGVLSASTSTAPMPMSRRFEGMAMAAEVRAPTPIEPGEMTVSANLHVTYEIE